MGGVVDSITGSSSKDASKDIKSASRMQAAYQRDALEYLKEREKIPQSLREQALKMQAGALGLEGGTGSQQEIIDMAMASPLYEAIMSGQESSEEAILRNAAMTGGLRSGNVQDALAENAEQLQNKALLTAYTDQQNQLRGLAGLPSNANVIAGATSGIGQTLAQGKIAATQAELDATQAGFGNLAGLADIGMQAYSTFSDRRLKKSIEKIGERDGFNWYKWVWNEAANMLGFHGEGEGFMIDELEPHFPDFIVEEFGYKTINYGALNV